MAAGWHVAEMMIDVCANVTAPQTGVNGANARPGISAVRVLWAVEKVSRQA